MSLFSDDAKYYNEWVNPNYILKKDDARDVMSDGPSITAVHGVSGNLGLTRHTPAGCVSVCADLLIPCAEFVISNLCTWSHSHVKVTTSPHKVTETATHGGTHMQQQFKVS